MHVCMHYNLRCQRVCRHCTITNVSVTAGSSHLWKAVVPLSSTQRLSKSLPGISWVYRSSATQFVIREASEPLSLAGSFPKMALLSKHKLSLSQSYLKEGDLPGCLMLTAASYLPLACWTELCLKSLQIKMEEGERRERRTER